MANDIDAVLIWVDGDDPVLRAKQAQYFTRKNNNGNAADTRYASCNEILYSTGSLLKFATFLRKIFIVTDNQNPNVHERLGQIFGAELVKKIEIIDHRTIFAGYESYLPVFNSEAIETMVHRIPGLAENFIYLNDDFFLVRPCVAKDFFRDGQPVLRGRQVWPLKTAWRLWRKGRRALRYPEKEPEIAYAHKETQLAASRLVGRRWRLFLLDHTPHAMRRSTCQHMETDYPKVMTQNISTRVRFWRQVNPAAFAAALEIKQGNRNLEQTSMVYIEAVDRRDASAYVARKLEAIDQKAARFLCIQSLDQTDPVNRDRLVAWLDARILAL